jgi:LuxR family transcriptional regulator, maltose regulon positive regulatory protein
VIIEPIPPIPSGSPRGDQRALLPRENLLHQLNKSFTKPENPASGFVRRLTLVCGPAGFGKTTAVHLWLESLHNPESSRPHFVWVTLNPETGRDSNQFASVLGQRLQAVNPEAAGEIPSGDMPLVPAFANRLLAYLARVGRPVLLIFDDFHLVNEPEIHEFVAYCLDRLPGTTHLVLISRSDPHLALGRLRVTGQLTELRARDLRLTTPEITVFLNELMGLDLSPADISLLEQRTEGWIAGLQLAAYSLSHQDDRAAFIESFAGDDRFIADYLIEEVLQRQTPERLTFMLRTSLLDKLSAELCDAALNRTNSRSLLHSLEADNLFLTPLDNRRQWYRYHRLFADLLQERLLEQNEPVDDLHRRAAAWFYEHGYLDDAVDHALAANDPQMAMDLMLLATPNLFTTNELSRLTRWGRNLTEETLRQKPRLIMALVWAWLATGHPAEAEQMLRLYESSLGAKIEGLCRSDPEMDRDIQAALIEGAAAASRLYIDQAAYTETLTLCRCSLDSLETLAGEGWTGMVAPVKDIPPAWPPYLNSLKAVRPVLLFNLGLALKFNNEIDLAGQALMAASEQGRVEGNSHIVALSAGHLAEIQLIQGRVEAAIATCDQGLTFLHKLSSTLSPLTGLILVQQGNAYYDLGNLSEAGRLWEQGIELAEAWGNWETLLPGYLGLARVRRHRRDYHGAIDALDTLISLTQSHSAIVSPIVAVYRQWLLADEHPDLAAQPAEYPSHGSTGLLPYFHEITSIVRARALIAGRNWAGAAAILDGLDAATESTGRFGRLLEIRLMLALAWYGLGRQRAAQQALEQALFLGQSEGIIQPFIESGAQTAELLENLPLGSPSARFGRHIRSLIPLSRPPVAGVLVDMGPDEGIFEGLTDREEEVLAYIAAGLSNKEIAGRLYVTEGTVKNHAHSIYGKLGVTSRTQAVAKARLLGMPRLIAD